MKNFIIKTLWFLSVPITLFFVLICMPYTKISYQLEDKIESVFIGDSHVQVAVMPHELIASESYAINSEATFFSYYKIKELLELNPNLKNIYLGFGYNNISSSYDDYIFKKHPDKILPRYLDLLPFGKKLQLIISNKSNFQVFFKEYLRLKFSGFEQGYNNRFDNTMAVEKSMTKRIKRQFFDEDGTLSSVSKRNILYLKKIKNLCSEHKVELILLNTPVHSFYLNLVPDKFKNTFDNVLKELTLVPFDFSNLELNDSCFTPDGDHLSQKGAKLLTKYLKNN
jgi:hypothetical protein